MGIGMSRQTWGQPTGHFPHPKTSLLSSDEKGISWKSSGCGDKPCPATTKVFSSSGTNSLLGRWVFHPCPQTAAGQYRQPWPAVLSAGVLSGWNGPALLPDWETSLSSQRSQPGLTAASTARH